MKGENRAKRELRLQEVQAIRAECYLSRSLPYVPVIAALVLGILFPFNNCRQNRSSFQKASIFRWSEPSVPPWTDQFASFPGIVAFSCLVFKSWRTNCKMLMRPEIFRWSDGRYRMNAKRCRSGKSAQFQSGIGLWCGHCIMEYMHLCLCHHVYRRYLSGGECKVSKKKGAKGMPSDGPGKHNPAKPRKNKSEVPVFDKAKGATRNERPRKTRIWIFQENGLWDLVSSKPLQYRHAGSCPSRPCARESP